MNSANISPLGDGRENCVTVTTSHILICHTRIGNLKNPMLQLFTFGRKSPKSGCIIFSFFLQSQSHLSKSRKSVILLRGHSLEAASTAHIQTSWSED